MLTVRHVFELLCCTRHHYRSGYSCCHSFVGWGEAGLINLSPSSVARARWARGSSLRAALRRRSRLAPINAFAICGSVDNDLEQSEGVVQGCCDGLKVDVRARRNEDACIPKASATIVESR